MRRAKLATMLAALSALALVPVACSTPPGPDPVPQGPGELPPPPCNVLSVGSCGLPFPSNQWTAPDPSSATGVRLDVPDTLIPADARDQLGPDVSSATLNRGADGFTTTTPVIFELPTRTDGRLPAGEPVVRVVDAATGAPVPVRVDVSGFAAELGGQGRFVVAWPRTRYEFGHTYIAMLDDRLRGAGGAAIAPAAGIGLAGRVATGSPLARLRDAVERVAPGDWPSLLSATEFTVRSERSATSVVDSLAGVVESQPHPVRNLTVGPSLVAGSRAIVTGQVRALDFRDERGILRPERPPRELWLNLLMTIPATPPPAGGYPIAIYGHGLTANKETGPIVAAEAVRSGMVAVGVDIPYHGERQYWDGGFVTDLAVPWAFGRLAAMTVQGVMDNLSLRVAIEQSFGTIDLVGATTAPDGRRDVDPTRLHYMGTSMGGVLGASLVGLSPSIDSAHLQVPGLGILDVIFNSVLWARFGQVVPRPISPGDAHVIVGLASLLMDTADATNLVGRIRANGTPMFLSYGVGDRIVPNVATDRMTALLGLPLVGPVLSTPSLPLPTRPAAVPGSIPGAFQIDTSSISPNDLLRGLGAHLAFGLPSGLEYQRQWAARAVEQR